MRMDERDQVARAICRASCIDKGACKFCYDGRCDPAMWRTFLPEADAAIATIDNLRSKNRAITEAQIDDLAREIAVSKKRPLLPGLGG